MLAALAKKQKASQAEVITALIREAFGGNNYDRAAALRSWNAAQILRRAERHADEDEEVPAAWV
jgi:hypothetical protein